MEIASFPDLTLVNSRSPSFLFFSHFLSFSLIFDRVIPSMRRGAASSREPLKIDVLLMDMLFSQSLNETLAVGANEDLASTNKPDG